MNTTSNLGLTQYESNDKYKITGNSNSMNRDMQIIDENINGLQDGLAILANGNTHAAISAGQFVYVRNHGTLANGLYKANSNISVNATLTSSNLTADVSGGLNDLGSSISALNSKIEKQSGTVTTVTNSYYEARSINLKKSGNIAVLKMLIACTTASNSDVQIATLPSGFIPDFNVESALVSIDIAVASHSAKPLDVSIANTGAIVARYGKAGERYVLTISYVVA